MQDSQQNQNRSVQWNFYWNN